MRWLLPALLLGCSPGPPSPARGPVAVEEAPTKEPSIPTPQTPIVATLQDESGSTPGDLSLDAAWFAGCPRSVGFVSLKLRVDEDGSMRDLELVDRAGLTDATVSCVRETMGKKKLSPPAAGSACLFAYVAFR